MKRWAGVVVSVAAVGVLAAGCGQGTAAPVATPSPSAPATLTINGNLALNTTSLGGGTLEDLTSGAAACYGTGGYTDVKEGAQVTVTDEASKVLGLGTLESGKYFAGACNFHFTIQNVAAGRPFYGVEVSRRGVIRFEGDKVQSPNLTLGS